MNKYYWMAMLLLFVGFLFVLNIETIPPTYKTIIAVWTVFYGALTAYAERD